MGDEEIEFAVVVVVEPDGAGGKSRITHSRLGGDIGEFAVAEIVEEMIGADGCDVDVDFAIIVVVRCGASQAVYFDGEPGLAGNVGERSVFVVVVKGGKRVAGLVPRPVHRVDEKNVLPAVVVVVKKASAAAHGFRKIFFPESAGVVFEVNAGLRRDVGELNGAGGTRRRFRGNGCRLCRGQGRCRCGRGLGQGRGWLYGGGSRFTSRQR